mgnify:FL=1
MIKRRIGFGKGIALALDGGRMEHHRAVHLPEIFQDFNERKDVMSVDRTVVIEVKRGKKRGLRLKTRMVCRSMSLATSQRCGTGLSTRLLISRAQLKALVETILARFLESAPAGGEMEQSLSLTITRSFTPFSKPPHR